MTTEPTITVLRVNVTAEMLQLGDGSAVAVQLAEPRPRWAIFKRSRDGSVEVAAVADSERDAQALAAEMLEARTKRLQ